MDRSAVQTVKAAVSISRILSKRGLVPASIGITTGEILHSIIGNERRKEASFLGQMVNLAARLMCLRREDVRKHGGVVEDAGEEEEDVLIFCDGASREQVLAARGEGDDGSFVPAGRFKLKGMTEDIEIWRVVAEVEDLEEVGPGQSVAKAAKNRGKWDGRGAGKEVVVPAVGYMKEKDELMTAFEEWRFEEHTRTFVVEGASGTGKTKILEFFLKEIENKKVNFCFSAGTEVDQSSPYHVFQGFFRDFVNLASNGYENKDFLKEYEHSLQFTIDARHSVYGNNHFQGLDMTKLGKKKVSPDMNSLLHSGQSKIVSKLEILMNATGQNLKLMPLLKAIVPWFHLEDNEVTREMQGSGRKESIRSLALGIIKKLSEMMPLVIIVDDAQWMDSSSMDLLVSIPTKCPKVFLLILTRPIDVYNLVSIKQLTASENTRSVKLEGFDMADTNLLLMNRLCDKGVLSIQPEFLKQFHDQTGGSPLFASQLIDLLPSRIGSELIVSKNGTLMRNPDSQSEELVSLSLNSAILSIFDKMDFMLRSLIKVASVFGQYFDLIDVVQFMDLTVEDAVNVIVEHDVFSFLQMIKSGEEDADNTHFMFRHIMIQSAIYNVLPYLSREELHLKIANLYEQRIDLEGEEVILPTLCYHLVKTSDVNRKIGYLEKLAISCVKKHCLAVGEQNLNLLVSWADSKIALVSDLRLGDWLSWLGHSQVFLRKVDESKANTIRALKLLKVDWPNTEKESKPILRRAKILETRLWIETFGGRRQLRRYKEEKLRLKTDAALRALFTLREIATWRPQTPLYEISLHSRLFLLTALQALKDDYDGFSKACIRKCLVYWLLERPMSLHFLENRALQILPKLSKSSYLAFYMMANNFAYVSRLRQATEFLRTCMRNAAEVGDAPVVRTCCFFQTYFTLISGNYSETLSAFFTAFESCLAKEEILIRPFVLGGSIIFAALADEWNNETFKVQEALDALSHTNGNPYQGILCGAIQFDCVKSQNGEGCIKHMVTFFGALEKAIPSQTIPYQTAAIHSIVPHLIMDFCSKEELIPAVQTIRGVIKKNMFNKWAHALPMYTIFLAAEQRAQGDSALALRTLRESISHIKIAYVRESRLVVAYIWAIIGRLSFSNPSKKNLYKKAINYVSGLGFTALLRWATGGDF
ncbi:hypothetical protein HDU97_008589 [Phlyctochytrium planicorne]|nr:hypothetical protein HDU97_008589 [Phlyctochytrium planicorne]